MTNSRNSLRIRSLASFLALVALLASSVPGQEITDVNDGPYVYWHDSTTATVFYLCGGEVRQDKYENLDTLRFKGMCHDSSFSYTVPAAPPIIEPHTFDGVSKIFTVSDIHGEYEYFADLLKVSGLVDEELRWIWGDGHLVIDGDVFDRGDGVTETLWLIYRLEQEAKLAGGRVHFTVGNHEKMVIRGDNRYVHDKYLKGIAKKTRIKHEDLYGADMELGRWLRTKHTAIVINGILFTHAGIIPEAIERGLNIDRLNDAVRAALDISSSELAFSDEPKFLLASKGPLWYRGLWEEREGRYAHLTQADVEQVLEYYGAGAVVVGHTGVDEVSSYFDGRVYAIDVPFEDILALQGLLWEDGKFYRVTGAGAREPLTP
jgi:hypothetical protein